MVDKDHPSIYPHTNSTCKTFWGPKRDTTYCDKANDNYFKSGSEQHI